MKNETAGGHWLDVALTLPDGTNRQGIGAVLRVYPAGKLGEAAALIAAREICVCYGYASGQEAIAHVGLAGVDRCGVEILPPHGRGRLERRDVAADQRLTVTVTP